MNEARQRLLALIPHLRYAAELAAKEGTIMFGVLSVQPDNGGRVVAQFAGAEFLADLALALDAPAETEESRLDAAAAAIVTMFGKGGK